MAQFIRLEQCQRYLRLRLHERANGQHFLQQYGVAPQSIPAILTRSGASFERSVEQAVGDSFCKINFAEDMAHAGQREDDNERVVDIVRDLEPGETTILFQPRLQVQLASWLIRGDVDIVRLERHDDGHLHILIVDMKASTTAKVEHRLQVAFYLEMLTVLLAAAAIPHQSIELGILYRGPADGEVGMSETDREQRERQRALAKGLFGTSEGLLEIVADPESYRGAVRDLVTDPQSVAARTAGAGFETIPFHLGYKCDGCLYNEFCMKWSAERDDLSLLPHITVEEKAALRRAGIVACRELAELKVFHGGGGIPAYRSELIPAPGKEELVRQLSATWPVGPHLDELIVRARRYRVWKGDEIDSISYIPSKGYGSLPYCDAVQNPNLVRVYIDAQHDYLNDRIYMIGALVSAAEAGEEPETRRRSIVHLTAGPPDTIEKERDLLLRFADDLIRTIIELAAPDTEGNPRAPIHLIFYNSFEQQLLLDALARHFDAILAATPLYDLVTQLAAFDSPIVSYLDREIREQKNYPMLCQSLQAVAAFLQFDWDQPRPYRQIFRTRMFDFWGKFDQPPPGQQSPWYTGRARFNSQVPLEYAYAAWGQLERPATSREDETYRGATLDLLRGFHARRLEALERVAKDFRGNQQTEKLPSLSPTWPISRRKPRHWHRPWTSSSPSSGTSSWPPGRASGWRRRSAAF